MRPANDGIHQPKHQYGSDFFSLVSSVFSCDGADLSAQGVGDRVPEQQQQQQRNNSLAAAGYQRQQL